MKKLLGVYLLLLIITGACTNSGEEKAKQSGKEIFFEEEFHNYGEIAENSNGSYGFIFKNVSDVPVIINRVRSSCGCTIPEWPREPIEPGESDKIQVRYNTELVGPFQKSIYVYSSAENSPVKLQIKGKVITEE
jgi:hypothetical protein